MMIACVLPVKQGASHRTIAVPITASAGAGTHVMIGLGGFFMGLLHQRHQRHKDTGEDRGGYDTRDIGAQRLR